jgi:hypothetical protein
MKVIGSRHRGFIESSGAKKSLIIRRMRCEPCRRVHHELPSMLVPYKRYDAASIEEVVEKSNPAVAADESTLYRQRQWFAFWSDYAVECLLAIALQFNLPVESMSSSLHSPLQRIGHYVGNKAGWLGRTVRPIANSHLWIQTRSACLSASSKATVMLSLPDGGV